MLQLEHKDEASTLTRRFHLVSKLQKERAPDQCPERGNMKNATLITLVVIAALAATPLATAQVYSDWDVVNAQYRVRDAIRNAETCGGYCSPGPANPYGVYGAAGYPAGIIGVLPGVGAGAVGGNRTVNSALVGAGIGAALGAVLGRDGRSTAIGATAGAAAFGGVAYATSRRGGNAVAGPSAGGGNGQLELSNQTRFAVEVYHRSEKGKEKYMGRLVSGDAWRVKAPKPGEAYHGFALIPNQNGGLSSDRLVPAPTWNGWVFVEPDFGRGQGRQ